jgi:hypothetical protein
MCRPDRSALQPVTGRVVDTGDGVGAGVGEDVALGLLLLEDLVASALAELVALEVAPGLPGSKHVEVGDGVAVGLADADVLGVADADALAEALALADAEALALAEAEAEALELAEGEVLAVAEEDALGVGDGVQVSSACGKSCRKLDVGTPVGRVTNGNSEGTAKGSYGVGEVVAVLIGVGDAVEDA